MPVPEINPESFDFRTQQVRFKNRGRVPVSEMPSSVNFAREPGFVNVRIGENDFINVPTDKYEAMRSGARSVVEEALNQGVKRAAGGAAEAPGIMDTLTGVSEQVVPVLRSASRAVLANPLARLGIIGAGAYYGIKGGLQVANAGDNRAAMSEADLADQVMRDANELASQAHLKIARQRNIDRTLAQLQREAPDIYNNVAAGRQLPDGAVVIGGQRRNDLLQELGGLLNTPGSL